MAETPCLDHPASRLSHQQHLRIKDVVIDYGVYPMPIGGKGLGMIDARDVGEIAAIELIRREQATGLLPLDRMNLVGPHTLTGADVAAIWSEVLDRPIAYGGDDTNGSSRTSEFSCRAGWRSICG